MPSHNNSWDHVINMDGIANGGEVSGSGPSNQSFGLMGKEEDEVIVIDTKESLDHNL